MTNPDQEQMGRLLGLQVVVSNAVPKGQAYLLGERVMLVPDLWRARWLVILANLRLDLQRHLAEVVRAAEERLGLLPCDHPRLTPPERDGLRYGLVVRCAVCREVVSFLSDEDVCTAEAAGVPAPAPEDAGLPLWFRQGWYMPVLAEHPRSLVKIVGL